MRKGSAAIELMVGVMILAGAVALFFLAMKVSNLGSFDDQGGYIVTARFDNIGGLKVRSPVTLAGVRVGQVGAIEVDRQTFDAVVSMVIQPAFNQIPRDTFAKILTSGLLGEQYVGLDPGGSMDFLEDGSEIDVTQSALVLEEIVGKFLFSKAEEAGAGDGNTKGAGL